VSSRARAPPLGSDAVAHCSLHKATGVPRK
jgi:hypothetical protein